MPKQGFHEQEFDDATRMKLEIIRRYVREWVSTLLTRSRVGKQFSQLNLYDFFAGPGRDGVGTPGSPLIMIEELRKYCDARQDLRSEVPVHLLFNDSAQTKIDVLAETVESVRCPNPCCTVEFSCMPFQEALPKHLPEMRSGGHANFVLMDQFGVGEVTPEVVRELLDCGSTDVLFFISSSFIRRFADTREMQSKLDVDPDELKRSDYKAIHRYICDHFRSRLGGTDYLLAPFSLKKGSNIYGLVFAASHPKAMEKFLSICWKLDPVTGEANYSIDNDPSWNGDSFLLPEFNTITRVSLFERALADYIRTEAPTNCQLYRFCLAQGFCASKAKESLVRLQKTGDITVWDITAQKPARRGSFYLGKGQVRVRFGVQGNAPE
jgi:three-Cys-motif partner protein